MPRLAAVAACWWWCCLLALARPASARPVPVPATGAAVAAPPAPSLHLHLHRSSLGEAGGRRLRRRWRSASARALLSTPSVINAAARPGGARAAARRASASLAVGRGSRNAVSSPFLTTAALSRSVKVRDGFFGIGPFELFVTFGLAFFLLGPEGLVSAARSLATFIRDLQPALRELAESSSEITDTINKELGIDEITDTIFTAQKEIQDAQSELTRTLTDAARKPPPPPPPPPTMTSLDEDTSGGAEGKKDKGKEEEEEFVPPSPEEIEELKKAKFWSPREEADAIKGEAASETSETSASEGKKLDGEAVFRKAMAMAEQQRALAESEAASSAIASSERMDDDSAKKVAVELTEAQLALLKKAEEEEKRRANAGGDGA